MNTKTLLTLSLTSMMLLAACNTANAPETEMDLNDDDIMTAPELGMEYSAALENLSTEASWQGEAMMLDTDGEKRVYASFDMDAPEENYFYEGWLVCNGVPYSTGATTRFDGLEENIYVGTINGECEKYVLTLEEDDGNPEPAEHLFDGEFTAVEEGMEMGIDYWYSETFDPMMEINHDELLSSLSLSCDSDLEFTWESLNNGSHTLVLESGSSAFLPTDGSATEFEEVTSISGAQYESLDENLLVMEKGGVFTIESRDRIAAENCIVL
jgi:hypothetical protein